MNEKPMSVARQELIDQLIDVVNSSNLPMFVVEPILQDLLASVRAAAQRQYEMDKAQYEKQINEG